jgi:aconitase (EC 4.2.1.3)
LVVAYALAGTVRIDLSRDPLGHDPQGQPVYLRDIWPTSAEIAAVLPYARDPETFRRLYANPSADLPLWQAISGASGLTYAWPESTYIAEPPFFARFGAPVPVGNIVGARALALLGDSITTDHISPAGSIKASSPAGQWLQAHRGTTQRIQ